MGSDADLERLYWRHAASHVGQLTELWLRIEEGDAGTAGPELKRLLHTMKGEAHMLGLADAAELLATMEEGSIDARSGPSEVLGDAFLSAVDVIALMAEGQGALPDGFRPVLEALQRATATRSSAPAPPPEDAGSMAEPVTSKVDRGLDPLELVPLIHEARRVHREQSLLRPRLREFRGMLRSLLLEIDPSLGSEELAERVVKTLSFGAELERRITALHSEWSGREFALDTALERLDDVIRAAALVSVAALEAQVHRTARSAARTVGKKVAVSFVGDAFVDATVERSLGPALLHLVRNAVDHGIELPEEREAAGKPAAGTVDVTIHQTESSVHVAVRDDGGGVDLAKLRARLGAQAPQDDRQLLHRIFDHGLSTRDEATELSGRGVGLDVVAERVGAVGGSVRVSSTPGVGTTFELVMPTMLRADVIVPVTVAGVRFALPARSVLAIERIEEPMRGADGWCVRTGDEGASALVPIFDLATIFGESRAPESGDLAVHLRHRTGRFAVRIASFGNPRTLSFERLEELPASSDVVVGVAPAPDGGVVFVLDVDLVHKAVQSGPAPAAHAPERRRAVPHVLVVEDAPVARELLIGLLRSFGLRVTDAADGRQGLQRAASIRPDLILTDVEMPGLGGLEMVAALRDDPRLAAVPVVVLTTRIDEEVRSRARALGVRAFLSKQRFVEKELRRVIDEALTGAPQ